jgi:hypothetical protein
MPQFHEVLAHFGITWPVTPFNVSFVLALLFALLLIWLARGQLRIRWVGANPTAAVTAAFRQLTHRHHNVALGRAQAGAANVIWAISIG